MLKKQTVWLLTMLSLMVVLSVYYLMSDQEDLAYVQRDEEAFPEEEFSPIDQEEQVEIENISTLGVSELFATLRMELEDERSLKKERLKDIIASSEATASEVNEAMNEINEIEKITSREKILQETILANYNNYEDVLVRADEDKVHVHVITEVLPKEEAVQIMQLVRDELGEVVVDINFQQNK